MDIQINGKVPKNLGAINVIMGKNGCGKSSLLRSLDLQYREERIVEYIMPERGGELGSDLPHIIISNPNKKTASTSSYDPEFRRKAISGLTVPAALAKSGNSELEKLLRQRENESFHDDRKSLNILLSDLCGLSLRYDNDKPIVIDNSDNKERPVAGLSSGEKELITLGAKIICFIFKAKICQRSDPTKKSLLLLDEPDAHLHPDAQYKFVKFLTELTRNKPIITIITTHSTAILGALNDNCHARVCFMREVGVKHFEFMPITKMLQSILPIFGAHPLTSVFGEMPLLLVEGEDDVRIWQRVIRSSNNKIKLYPVECGGNGGIAKVEDLVNDLIFSLYEPRTVAYSLQDSDEKEIINYIKPKGSITKLWLHCREPENLLLSNEVLASLGIAWYELQEKIEKHLEESYNQKNDPWCKSLTKFKNDGYDRKHGKIKDFRNQLICWAGNNTSWEDCVGKEIAKILTSEKRPDYGDVNSICNFLGEDLVEALKIK